MFNFEYRVFIIFVRALRLVFFFGVEDYLFSREILSLKCHKTMQLQMPHTLEVLENEYAICVCIHFNIIAAGFFLLLF